MKKVIVTSFVLAMGIGLNSCTNEEEIVVNDEREVQEQPQTSQMLEFDSKEQLFAAINGVITRGLPDADLQGYTSLMDEVNLNDPHISSVPQDEQLAMKREHMTYYEAFELESYFPNEDFARLINTDCEICVKDTIYKITEKGTLMAHKSKKGELESAYNQLPDKPVFNDNGVQLKKLTSNVKIINTFKMADNGRSATRGGYSLGTFLKGNNAPKQLAIDEEEGTVGGGGGNNNHSNTNNSDTPLYNIPWSSFDTYSSGYKTFIGKLWGSVFGERSTKHDELGNGYRVNGSLYDYDYGVYHECGAFVSMSKKRGGFFKFINGWKDVNADELVMDWEPVVLEIDLKIPQNLIPPTNRNTVLGYENNCKLLGENRKCVTILGLDITEKQIYQWVGNSLKELLKSLNSKCNAKIDDDTKAVKIIGPSKVYTVVYPSTTWKHNQNKYRKVFDSGVRFIITNNIFTAPTSVKTWMDVYNKLRSFPQTDIKKGTVRLAGRKDGKWGGMIINKD